MADEARNKTNSLALLKALEAEPGRFDFYAAMRRLECLFPDLPRWGEALRPSDEPIRLGQDPELGFRGSALSNFRKPSEDASARLGVAFFGLFGPQGPLPTHLTEYARSRALHHGDRSFNAFADIFHHRLLLLFYRAWATAQPTVGEDRPNNPFATYVGSLMGLGAPSLQNRDALPDKAKLQYAAWLGSSNRSADGLRAMVEDYFGLPATVEEFIGAWVDIPPADRLRLGAPEQNAGLGFSTVLGTRVWSCTHKFRLVLGPLQSALNRFMPDGDMLPQLVALVRAYTGDEYEWDVRLIPAADTSQQVKLGANHPLGWGSRLGRFTDSEPAHHLVVDPSTGKTSRVRPN